MFRADDGFTLFETLVALAVFSLIASSLYLGLAGGWQGITDARRNSIVLGVARARLASAGVVHTLSEGTRSGTTANGVAWSVETRSYNIGNSIFDAAPGAELPKSYWVTVRASLPAHAGRSASSVVLKSLKISRPAP